MKEQPCGGQNTHLSKIGEPRLMQAGCGAQVLVMHVADDRLIFEA